MSSIVNLDMCLIASKGLLPVNILHDVFKDTIKELNGVITNDILTINGTRIGKISLMDRIVVQTYSENVNFVTSKTKEIREVFTRRSQIAIKNYRYELEQEKRRIQESDLAFAELQKRIEQADKKILEQEHATEKQQMSSCEAIVLELKEAAENQGYDITEEKTKEGVQLQFVRRVY